MSKQKFNGQIDKFGYPFLFVDLINPNTAQCIVHAKAIIDTGAAYTHIKQHVIDAININSNGEIDTKHLTEGNLKSGVFKINIRFNDSITVPNIEANLLHLIEYPSVLSSHLTTLQLTNGSRHDPRP
jgi:predicted aspartyl protease